MAADETKGGNAAYEEGDDDVTLNPLDPETEEKLREQHGIEFPGWTPNRPAANRQELLERVAEEAQKVVDQTSMIYPAGGLDDLEAALYALNGDAEA